MIRRGFYCKYKGKLFTCGFKNDVVLLRSNDIEDVKKRGFIDNEFRQEKTDGFYNNWNTLYRKNVPIEKIDWFCSISTIGYYKGYEVSIRSESETQYSISTGIIELGNSIFTEENGFQMVDRQMYAGHVSKDEVTNITEIKRPISKDYKAPDNWDF